MLPLDVGGGLGGGATSVFAPVVVALRVMCNGSASAVTSVTRSFRAGRGLRAAVRLLRTGRRSSLSDGVEDGRLIRPSGRRTGAA